MKRITIYQHAINERKSTAVLNALRPYANYQLYAATASNDADSYTAIAGTSKTRRYYIHVNENEFTIEKC